MDLNRITIGNLQKKDTGNYGCNATNKIGYVYKDAYVNVLSLPPDIQVILMNAYDVYNMILFILTSAVQHALWTNNDVPEKDPLERPRGILHLLRGIYVLERPLEPVETVFP